MFIEQPPLLYRALYPKAIWRLLSPNEQNVYLTFDDGPIPEVTPWVLDVLDKYQVKATFFCVADNVRKYPDLYQELLSRGHRVGNHTFNHWQGIHHSKKDYIENVEKGFQFITSNLFRPPHGHMRFSQYHALEKDYKIVMWDVVTRDYSKYKNPDDIFNIVQKYTRNGSIIVFHDSLKAENNLRGSLERSIEWLLEHKYSFKLL